MEKEIISYYEGLRDEAVARVKVLSGRIALVGTARLVVFCCGIVAAWALWGDVACSVGVVVAALVAFLLLVKVHERYFNAREIANARLDIARDNLNRIALKLDECPTGENYVDSHHPYTYDLDVFGKNSLFSLLDTTCTVRGGKRLAKWLCSPLDLKAELPERQESIKELSGMNDFRTEFRTFGMVRASKWKNGEIKGMTDFTVSLWIKIMAVAYPLIMVAAIVMSMLDVISASMVVYLFIVGILIAVFAAKSTSQRHRELEQTVESLSNMGSMLQLVEKTQFSSSLLMKLKHNLKSDSTAASVASRKLGKILTNFDQRYNAVTVLLLNGLALWDMQCLWSAERWMRKYGKELEKWNKSMAQIDALSALGTYTFNNFDYHFPKIDPEEKVIMQASKLGHPLIARNRCVRNDVATMTDGTFQVITGANMAGKSTYLRTVGINYLLAMIGTPVCATEMTFTPVNMLTGLRTTDSLHDNESYFFAELKRLQSIIEHANAGERMMVILDEILKGTNSADKQSGSLALVSKLVTLRVAGIIATHDLMLGSLAEKFPNKVSNYRFEATISNDNLTFSYEIHPGVAQKMNACFLMSKMGII